MDNYQKYIHMSRYSRWDESLGRRENWDETVNRLRTYWTQKFPMLKDEIAGVIEQVRGLEVMGSMRTLWTAGKALDVNNVAGYNCAYVTVNTTRAFDETLYILSSGAGVGFSVEEQYTRRLPIVNDVFESTGRTIPVGDSKEGWAKALRKHIADLYLGRVNTWDYSGVRPAGAPLKTMGGRASGPEPLRQLMNQVTKIFKEAAGRKLTPLECHDIMCAIGAAIVVGGVRRSAMISLSGLSDHGMRGAKSGVFPEFRHLANNSAVYESKPTIELFMSEWLSLVESRSGERGMFSRYASDRKVAENGRREIGHEWGTNPCSEIILRPQQFCNLSEVVARRGDTREDLLRKVRSAAILGTLQSTLTNFPYLRDIWRKNTAEERLLGVSLTGIQDCELLQNPDPALLEALRAEAVATNAKFAALIGVEPSTAVTAVKPSGTVSQLVDSASGIHGRFSPFYVRRVRQDVKDPLATLMKQQGVPWEQALNMDGSPNEHIVVFSFPKRSPAGSVLASEQTALSQLENWVLYADHWCEHKPSVTIYVRPEEWLIVGDWVYRNFDKISGVSFLPYSEHNYVQAPYEAITEEEFMRLSASMPEVDFDQLVEFEMEDNTEGATTLACVAGACEV